MRLTGQLISTYIIHIVFFGLEIPSFCNESLERVEEKICREAIVHRCDLCNEYFENEFRLKIHVLDQRFDHHLIKPESEIVEILDDVYIKSEKNGKILNE